MQKCNEGYSVLPNSSHVTKFLLPVSSVQTDPNLNILLPVFQTHGIHKYQALTYGVGVQIPGNQETLWQLMRDLQSQYELVLFTDAVIQVFQPLQAEVGGVPPRNWKQAKDIEKPFDFVSCPQVPSRVHLDDKSI